MPDCAAWSAPHSARPELLAPATSSSMWLEYLPGLSRDFPTLAVLPRALPARKCRRPAALRLPPPSGTGVRLRALPPCSAAVPASPAFERMRSLALLVRGTQTQSHGPREHLPFRLFGDELSAPARREAIVPRAFAFVRQFPRGCDPAFCLQPMQRGVQGTGLNL